MSVEIKEVKTKDELKAFVKFPFKLYKGHPHWVPPVIRGEMAALSEDTNPVFEHSEAVLYTAWKGGEMVGRIAGMINQKELDFINEKHARFGWIDFVDDREVSRALLNAVEKWGRGKGMTLLKGPYGFNQLDRNGMLTEGFDSTGTANTIYNYAYYPEHLKELGYEKELEWVEVFLKAGDKLPDRLLKVTELAKRRFGIKTAQPKTTEELMEMGDQLFDLLMETYRDLPGFVPISDKQRKAYLNRYIKFLRKDFVVIVLDSNDEPIGFSVTLPSMSKAYKRAKGKLFPFGILHMLAARKWPEIVDLALIGVKEEWRKKGAHGFIFAETGKAVMKTKARTVQINPMLEFNNSVLALWKDYDHRIYKRRKTFKKLL